MHDIDQIGRIKNAADKQIPAGHRPRGFLSMRQEPAPYFRTIAVNG
jgi:hypothetical protein